MDPTLRGIMEMFQISLLKFSRVHGICLEGGSVRRTIALTASICYIVLLSCAS
jgi:hypothetical protein